MLPKKTCGTQTQTLKYTYSSRREGRVEGENVLVHFGKSDQSTEIHNFWFSGFDSKTAPMMCNRLFTRYFSGLFEYKWKASNCL